MDAINTVTQWFTKASSLGLSPGTWLGIGVAIFFAITLILLGLRVFGKEVKRDAIEKSDLTESTALADTEILHLHLYGDERVPTLISSNNVWRWYYLRNIIKGVTKKGKLPETIGTITILFISFDRPVKVTTLEVRSSDTRLPTHEVKEFNNRFAIIVFSDALPMGTLEVTVKNAVS